MYRAARHMLLAQSVPRLKKSPGSLKPTPLLNTRCDRFHGITTFLLKLRDYCLQTFFPMFFIHSLGVFFYFHSPHSMAQGCTRLIKKIFSVCTPGVLAAAVMPIFVHSVGGRILCNKTLPNEGRLVFLVTTIIGQFVYSLLSSSRLGMIYFPLLDSCFSWLDRMY
ncbi:hypothetical protein EBI_26973 [Enterocytozoon bieneusi H348]|nr:hypothetical protein EBI_26973 [Enterocytozoon bieneusi H348]|eukprot:XP_002652404.1 hypothetical protein EBI_26973 [Enterocytozoon bieneusi H348]